MVTRIFLKSTIARNFHFRIFNRNKWSNALSSTFETSIRGQQLTFEVGELTKMADGCCVAKLGNTAVMATAVCDKTKASSTSFVPLLVDFHLKAASANRIPMTQKRREFGQTDNEILTSRLIDRSIRPFFPKEFSFQTQVTCHPMVIDRVQDPDVVSINAASAALAVSDIPWNGPIGAVRVGLIDDQIVINPSRKDLARSSLNLIVSATEQKHVVMLEGSATHVPRDRFMEAVESGVNETQLVIETIHKIREQRGKSKIAIDNSSLSSSDMMESATLLCEANISDIFKDFSLDKVSRDNAVKAVVRETLEKMKENYPDSDSCILNQAINFVVKETYRKLVLENEIRCDGRSLTDIRPISCKINKYENLHGSAVFERGQTQVFCTVTFDSIGAAMQTDPVYAIPGESDKNFILHYEFPPYATNEIGKIGVSGRREIGHGNLAEKSLKPVIPENFPFTIRLTSEVLGSNGSSSMASVCGGSLALMDAGVPISVPVAGIAMGLITSSDDYKIMTDIMGLEDYLGDMDFKIASSNYGITCVQLDVKIPGLPLNIIKESLDQATDGCGKILEIMNKTISSPREERKSNWPVADTLQVPIHKLFRLTGLGGANLKRIRAETGVQLISTEPGSFYVFAPDSGAMQEAKDIIDKLLHDEVEMKLEYGAIYPAKIVEIRESGAMVSLYPTMKPTLIKNSMLDQRKIKHPSALGLEVGQEIQVKYFGRDPVDGKMRLSRSALTTPRHLKI